MSKIEKALDRAKQSRGMALVKTPGRERGASEPAPDSQRQLSDFKPGSRSISRKASTEAIARMKEDALRTRSDLASAQIISPDMSDNPTVQAFREIRTRVLQHMQGRNGVILVASATGGGSFVARNLAVAFAFDAGRTSLLVDCDLHNPSLTGLLKGQDAMGVTDYLVNPEMSIGDIIHPVGIERLRVIPAGSGDHAPAEHFLSDRARQLFLEIRDRYPERIVILDAPPMMESADTRILADVCDYVLLVVPYARLTNTQIDHCINSVDGRKLIGIVFNDEPQYPPIQVSAGMLWRQLNKDLSGALGTVRAFLRWLIQRGKHT